MASSDDLVKYITQRVVTYMEMPREERKNTRNKEPWTVKWFGMIPFSMSLWAKQSRPFGRKKE
ncbi:YqzE family protein [Paenibacillus sp. JX-17]|uniref:YqzE family protein n=1 Tax=Paenibacillus lacisoli TaxID=3064525 RepID=A0ABT9C9P2_9BACL|nr:YqzE family protein [Paenibacillus sp. JX-17]MDO7905975.1 YqzE family protein [Paenibacillus sp. JX-17]